MNNPDKDLNNPRRPMNFMIKVEVRDLNISNEVLAELMVIVDGDLQRALNYAVRSNDQRDSRWVSKLVARALEQSSL